MKNILERIFVTIIAIICITGTVYAASQLFASDIKYKNTTVDKALDDLYKSVKNFNNYKLDSLIPNMTSNVAPSGKVEASGYASGREPYNAFSGRKLDLNNASTFWYDNTSSTKNISYTWDEDIYIGYIAFYRHVTNNFSVQYLNDNDEWVKIKSYAKIGNTDTTEYEEYYLPNIVKTKSIRFNFNNESIGFLASVRVLGIRKIN